MRHTSLQCCTLFAMHWYRWIMRLIAPWHVYSTCIRHKRFLCGNLGWCSQVFWAALAITATQVCMPCIHDLSYLQKAARVDPHRPTRTWWCDYANLIGCECLIAKPWNSHQPHSPYYTELPTFLAQLSEMKYVFICHKFFYKYCAKTIRDSWVCNYFVYFQYAATTGMCSDMH